MNDGRGNERSTGQLPGRMVEEGDGGRPAARHRRVRATTAPQPAQRMERRPQRLGNHRDPQRRRTGRSDPPRVRPGPAGDGRGAPAHHRAPELRITTAIHGHPRIRKVDAMWGTLPKVFDRTCTYYADRTALVDADRRLSYAQMRQWANRVGNGLTGLGVGNGHRVGLLMPNCLEFIPTMCGIWKAGAAVTQMPTRASAEDFHYFLDEVGAS